MNRTILSVILISHCIVTFAQDVHTLETTNLWYGPILRKYFPTEISVYHRYRIGELPCHPTDITRFDVTAGITQGYGSSAYQVSGSVTLGRIASPFNVLDGAQGKKYMLHLHAYLFSPSGQLVWQQKGYPEGGAWVNASGGTVKFTLINSYSGSTDGHTLLILAAGDPIFSSLLETRVLLGAKRISSSPIAKVVQETGTTKDAGDVQEIGTFIDERDGQEYKWVTINNEIWMRDNLNYLTSEGSWCFDDSEANCDVYGRLYDWKTALKVCPSGWHLPSFSEWNVLVQFVGGYPVAGGRLKETGTSHWNSPNAGASNKVGFTALPGDSRRGRDGAMFDTGGSADFWSSLEHSTTKARSIHISSLHTAVNEIDTDKKNGYSVRCVKD